MSLLIQFKKKYITEIVWNTGSDKPSLNNEEIDEIRNIQADGEELKHVRSMFPTNDEKRVTEFGVNTIVGVSPLIPKGSVVTIFGDLAKTIVANL